MKFYSPIYGVNLDLDASVQTNKLSRFCPLVFNGKENVMRSFPLEIIS